MYMAQMTLPMYLAQVVLPDPGVDVDGAVSAAISLLGTVVAIVVGGFFAFRVLKWGLFWSTNYFAGRTVGGEEDATFEDFSERGEAMAFSRDVRRNGGFAYMSKDEDGGYSVLYGGTR